MNEQLYRTNDPDSVLDLVVDGILVPVEPCEHGKIDEHDTEYDPWKDRALDGHRCPGAALGMEDS